jgi:type IV secretory pathway VirB3-like protein
MWPGLLCRCWIPPRTLADVVVWIILVVVLWVVLWTVVLEAFLWCFLGIGLVVGVHDVVAAVIVWNCIHSGQLSDRHLIWQAASLGALALRKHRRNDWQKRRPDAELALAGARSWRLHRWPMLGGYGQDWMRGCTGC